MAGGRDDSFDNAPPGGRPLAVRVRRARRRKPSSTEWLQRQLNDPFVAEARRRGFRSRAAFKLLQLDERFHLLAPGRRVIDLGAAPGGWTQVAAARVGAAGRVVALDLNPLDPVPGATVLQGDFRDPATAARLRDALGGGESGRRQLADLVLSDMAAPATGHAATDHLRIVALAEDAFAFAETLLKPGGAFVAKVFQGGAEGSLLAALKRAFAEVRHAKPAASRAESAETYVVAKFYRGPIGGSTGSA
jgi:23S rRNA (uridine2552-2'-O)-methyltransferase